MDYTKAIEQARAAHYTDQQILQGLTDGDPSLRDRVHAALQDQHAPSEILDALHEGPPVAPQLAPPAPDLGLKPAQLPPGLTNQQTPGQASIPPNESALSPMGMLDMIQNYGNTPEQMVGRKQVADLIPNVGLPVAGAAAATALAPETGGASAATIPGLLHAATTSGLGAAGGQALLNLIKKLGGQQAPEGIGAWTDPALTGVNMATADLMPPAAAGLSTFLGKGSSLSPMLAVKTLFGGMPSVAKTALIHALGPEAEAASGATTKLPLPFSQQITQSLNPSPTGITLRGLLNDNGPVPRASAAGHGFQGAYRPPAPAPPQTEGIGAQPQSILPTPKSILNLLKKMGAPAGNPAEETEASVMRPGTAPAPEPGVQPGKSITLPKNLELQVQMNVLARAMKNPDISSKEIQATEDFLTEHLGYTKKDAVAWIQDKRFKF